MVDVSGADEAARNRVKRLFDEQSINEVSIDIQERSGFAWGEPNSRGWFGIPDGNGKFCCAAAWVNVDDWLQLQQAISGVEREPFENSATTSTIDWVKDCAESDSLKKVPEPVLEINRKSYVVKKQEGRSRGIGARKAGLERIPIWVVGRRERK